jgi:hypothetical protein
MNKDTKNIILLALLGFGAFRYLKAKNTTIAPPSTPQADFIAKVMKLQEHLGVKVDGIPAQETNGAMRARYGLAYGNISPKNIDQYLSDLHL